MIVEKTHILRQAKKFFTTDTKQFDLRLPSFMTVALSCYLAQ